MLLDRYFVIDGYIQLASEKCASQQRALRDPVPCTAVTRVTMLIVCGLDYVATQGTAAAVYCAGFGGPQIVESCHAHRISITSEVCTFA